MNAKPCMMLSKHQHFIACRIDPVHFNVLASTVVETFAREVRNKNYDITGRAGVVEGTKRYVKAMDSGNNLETENLWIAFAGLSHFQTFCKEILQLQTHKFYTTL